jgi:signal transduction histidine kinase
MGLTVAKKIISLHNGTITAENREDGRGLCVSIVLKQSGGLRTSV